MKNKLNMFGKKLHEQRGLHILDEWDDSIFSINNFLEVVKESKKEFPEHPFFPPYPIMTDDEKNHKYYRTMLLNIIDWFEKWFGEFKIVS